MSYPFQYNDAGQSKTARPKEQNVCVIRALSIALDQDYEEVYKTVQDMGREYGKRTPKAVWDEISKHFEKISFPAVKGQRRMNPSTFSDQYKDGVYIVRVAKHVFTFINGVAQDKEQERADRCIYTAFKIK